jgi:upstream activation factor subunit UAF30
MARPTIVKELWAYIRENNLQNPAKKSEIINDDLFVEIFGVKTMTMFSMSEWLRLPS